MRPPIQSAAETAVPPRSPPTEPTEAPSVGSVRSSEGGGADSLRRHKLIDLLDSLAARGVHIAAQDGRLRFRPQSAVPPDLVVLLRQHRDDLLCLLGATGAGSTSASSAAELRALAAAGVTLADGEWRAWSPAAREHYIDRLAVADDLGLDTTIGSDAERVARREARRIGAGFPSPASASRDGDLIDAALEAFAPLGGLRLVDLKPREQAATEASQSPRAMQLPSSFIHALSGPKDAGRPPAGG